MKRKCNNKNINKNQPEEYVIDLHRFTATLWADYTSDFDP